MAERIKIKGVRDAGGGALLIEGTDSGRGFAVTTDPAAGQLGVADVAGKTGAERLAAVKDAAAGLLTPYPGDLQING